MSFIKIWIHAVWGTRNREPLLKPPVLAIICQHIVLHAKTKNIYIDVINGYHDHLHVLMLLSGKNTIGKQVQCLKGESAHWANQQRLTEHALHWSEDYFATSVSQDKIETVKWYINNQQLHHQTKTFVQEYQSFIRRIQ